MKYQFRKGCFETNSSSMHSLIITKKNSNVRMTQQEIRDEYYLDEEWNKGKNIICLDKYDNDFDRSPFSVLTTFRDKLTYAIAEYCGDNYSIDSYLKAEETFDEIFRPLIIRLTGVDDVNIDYMFETKEFYIYSDKNTEYLDEAEEVPYDKRVHREDWKRGENYYESYDVDGRPIEEAWFDVPDFGSIDHQSKGLLTGFLKSNNLSLEDYLTRKDIACVIDGDEYCEFDNLIDCGLISKDSIVLRFPKSDSYDVCKENENEENCNI
jgi:hypothetical protein